MDIAHVDNTLVELSEECPVSHMFSEGVYTREIFMPAGVLVIGKTHKTTHLNVVLTGRCEVLINGELRTLEAPYTFESLAGSQKTLYIFEDCRWMTIHVNKDNERDLSILEDRYIDSEDTQGEEILKLIKNQGGNKCLGQ